jgi:hypothetical protein
MAKKIAQPMTFVNNKNRKTLEKFAQDVKSKEFPKKVRRCLFKLEEWTAEERAELVKDMLEFCDKEQPRYIIEVLQKVGLHKIKANLLSDHFEEIREAYRQCRELCELNFLKRADEGHISDRLALGILHLQSSEQMDHVRWEAELKAQSLKEGAAQAPTIQFLSGTTVGGDKVLKHGS